MANTALALVCFGSNSFRASLLRSQPKQYRWQVSYKETENQYNLFNQLLRLHFMLVVINPAAVPATAWFKNFALEFR